MEMRMNANTNRIHTHTHIASKEWNNARCLTMFWQVERKTLIVFALFTQSHTSHRWDWTEWNSCSAVLHSVCSTCWLRQIVWRNSICTRVIFGLLFAPRTYDMCNAPQRKLYIIILSHIHAHASSSSNSSGSITIELKKHSLSLRSCAHTCVRATVAWTCVNTIKFIGVGYSKVTHCFALENYTQTFEWHDLPCVLYCMCIFSAL